MKVAHEELQTTVSSFVEKDAEIKKLFDMFESTLKAVSEENAEIKEKFENAQKENESLKGMILEYQKDLTEAKEQMIQASKVMDEFQQMKKTQIQAHPRYSNITDSTMGRKSEPAITDARPSFQKQKETPKSQRAYGSQEYKLADQGDIERIDEEEDQESSQSVHHRMVAPSKRVSDRESVLRQSNDLAFLRESNKLLKKQNQSLMLQTKLLDEKTKKEKDEYGRVVAADQYIVENIAKAIKDIKGQTALKVVTSDSEDDAYKLQHKKPKKRAKARPSSKRRSEEKVAVLNTRASR